MINKKYEIESLKLTISDLEDMVPLTQAADVLNTRLETILYGDEDSGRRTKINSIVPLYDKGKIEDLLVFFEKEEQIGIVFNIKEEVHFYPKEYLNIFKEGNKIRLKDEVYTIENIIFDLDMSDYILLRVDLKEVE